LKMSVNVHNSKKIYLISCRIIFSKKQLAKIKEAKNAKINEKTKEIRVLNKSYEH